MIRQLLQKIVVYACCVVLLSSHVVSALEFGDYLRNGINDYNGNENAIANTCSSNGGITLSGNTDVDKIMNALMNPSLGNKKMSLEQASGVVGNFMWETMGYGGIDNGQPKVNPAAEQVPGSDKGGHGIAQWDDRFRSATGLKKYAESMGKPWQDLEVQIKFMLWEVGLGEAWGNNAGGAARASWEATLKEATPEAAAETWMLEYERPGNPHLKERADYARKVFDIKKNISSVQPIASGATKKNTTIVLDPGHGSSVIFPNDPISGLPSAETPNTPEREDMLATAQDAKAQLEKEGYTVLLTKNTPTDSPSFRARAETGKTEGAVLGMSLHYDGTQRFGNWGEVYAQTTDSYRGEGAQKFYFKDAKVAADSQKYAASMVATRNKIETKKGETKIAVNTSFQGRNMVPGNIPFVQLYSGIPWIYLEAGGIGFDKAIFTQSVVEGVKAMNLPPSTNSANTCNGDGAITGNISATARNLAWPHTVNLPSSAATGYGRDAAKPEYVTAASKLTSDYHTAYFTDCGVFVATVMISSGVDPNYPKRVTGVQQAYMDKMSRETTPLYKYIKESEIQPGDILVNATHTYIYTGEYTASDGKHQSSGASLYTRPPSGDSYYPAGFNIFRYIGGANNAPKQP